MQNKLRKETNQVPLPNRLLCLALAACGAALGQSWNHDPGSPNGPLSWGFLGGYNSFATCGTDKQAVGARQTPIDIVTASATPSNLPPLTFHYGHTALVVENLTHVVEVVMKAEGTLQVGPGPTDTYKLLQFHFHTPSEHKINGVASQMEVHFVHRNSLGDLAVVGAMMNVDDSKANPLFDKIFSNAPYLAFFSGGNTSSPNLGEIDPTELLPEHRTYYTYSGSLTTPPCSEGVRWFVLTDPVYVSSSSVPAFQRVLVNSPNNFYPRNNRPIQPLNGRAVLVSQ